MHTPQDPKDKQHGTKLISNQELVRRCPFEKHVLRLDLNIGTESVTECVQEIPASRHSNTLTPDTHYREHIPGGVKPLITQSTRAWEDSMARSSPAECVGWCFSLPKPTAAADFTDHQSSWHTLAFEQKILFQLVFKISGNNIHIHLHIYMNCFKTFVTPYN